MRINVTQSLHNALTLPESSWTDKEVKAMQVYEAMQYKASVRSHNRAGRGSQNRDVEVTLVRNGEVYNAPVVPKSDTPTKTTWFRLHGFKTSNCPKCNSRFFPHYVHRETLAELLDENGDHFGKCRSCNYDYKPE